MARGGGRTRRADESFANALAGDRRVSGYLDGVFGNSPALSRALAREPAQLRKVAEHGPDAAFENALEEMSSAACRSGGRRALVQRLRAAKRRALVTAALADIAGAWPLDKVAAFLTRFADATIAGALDHLLRRLPRAAALCPPTAINRRWRAG